MQTFRDGNATSNTFFTVFRTALPLTNAQKISSLLPEAFGNSAATYSYVICITLLLSLTIPIADFFHS